MKYGYHIAYIILISILIYLLFSDHWFTYRLNRLTAEYDSQLTEARNTPTASEIEQTLVVVRDEFESLKQVFNSTENLTEIIKNGETPIVTLQSRSVQTGDAEDIQYVSLNDLTLKYDSIVLTFEQGNLLLNSESEELGRYSNWQIDFEFVKWKSEFNDYFGEEIDRIQRVCDVLKTSKFERIFSVKFDKKPRCVFYELPVIQNHFLLTENFESLPQELSEDGSIYIGDYLYEIKQIAENFVLIPTESYVTPSGEIKSSTTLTMEE